MRRKWGRVVAVLLVLFFVAVWVFPPRHHVGGQWYTISQQGWVMESGGSESLHRSAYVLFTRKVDEFIYGVQYIGDDCVIYIVGSDRNELMAACGDHKPVLLSEPWSKSGIDWMSTHQPLSDNPLGMSKHGDSLTHAEIKRRAKS